MRRTAELFICGRIKDIVIANGRKYHPQDLEWAVDDLPGIRRGRIVAFAGRRVGLADRVVIVLQPSGAVEAGVLTQSIRQRVADVCGLYVDEVVLSAQRDDRPDHERQGPAAGNAHTVRRGELGESAK